MADGKFLIGCTAKQSPRHHELIETVKAQILNGSITNLGMAKRALLES